MKGTRLRLIQAPAGSSYEVWNGHKWALVPLNEAGRYLGRLIEDNAAASDIVVPADDPGTKKPKVKLPRDGT